MPIYPYSFTLPPVNKQDIPNDGVAGEFLGISAGGVLDWLPVSASGSGDLLAANNLSELTATAGTARTNLGLGTTDTPTFKNLVISTGSIATSTPVTISQTWADVAQTFTAFKVNAAGTSAANSASGSLLLDLQVSGVSQFKVDKTGNLTTTGTSITTASNGTWGTPSAIEVVSGGHIRWASRGRLYSQTADSISILDSSATLAATLAVDASNTLALRNGAAAQTFNVYGTYSTSPSLAYSRLAIACDTSGNATLTTQSTGTAGTLSINGVPVGKGTGTQSFNLAVGPSALAFKTTGDLNIAIGVNSSAFLTTGNQNTSLGANSLFANTTGSNNTAVGYQSARYIADGATANTVSENSVFLGVNTKALASGQTNQIVIGHDATGLGSNTAVLGNSSITTTALRGNVGIGTTNPVADLDLADTWNGPVINVTGASGTGSVATVTFAAQAAAIPVGTTVVIASMNPAGYDGTVVVTASSTTSVSYANATTAAYVVGGTVQRQFTAIKVNITDTASALTSKLLDLQVDGLSQAYVDKNGAIYGRGSSTGGLSKTWINLSGYYQVERFGTGVIFGGYPGQFMLPASSFMGWNSGETISASVDVKLFRDTNNTLALRNSTAAQTFRVYNTFPGTGNNEFGSFNWVDQANEFQIATGQAGTGTSRALCLRGQGGLNIRIGSAPGTLVWQVGMSTGHLLAGADNTYDIGASGASRPRNVYVGGQVRIAGDLFASGNTQVVALFTFGTGTPLRLSDGTGSDFSRLQFGGAADTFPAIARDGAGIKFTGAAAGLTSHIKVPAVAVSALPLAATAGVGARAFVNDATAPIFGSVVTGGGSVPVPVYSTGSAWNVG